MLLGSGNRLFNTEFETLRRNKTGFFEEFAKKDYVGETFETVLVGCLGCRDIKYVYIGAVGGRFDK